MAHFDSLALELIAVSHALPFLFKGELRASGRQCVGAGPFLVPAASVRLYYSFVHRARAA